MPFLSGRSTGNSVCPRESQLSVRGNAREIAAIVRDITRAGQGEFEFAGFVVSDVGSLGPHDSRNQLLGDFVVCILTRSMPWQWVVENPA